MATFAPEVIGEGVGTGLLTAVEVHAPLEQILDRVRTLFNHVFDDGLVAESGTRVEGVLYVGIETVFGVHDRSDPSLGVIGRRLGRALLGHDGDVAVLGHTEGEMQPGHTAADHHEVEFQGCAHGSSILVLRRFQVQWRFRVALVGRALSPPG